MTIQRINLKSFRCFDRVEWNLNPTFQTLLLGRCGGKTSLCRAVQTVFLPVEQHQLNHHIRRGENSSSVELDFKLNDISWTIRKDWSSQNLQEWTARSVQKKFELNHQEELDAWIRFFLQQLGYSNRQNCSDIMYRELLYEQYALWIQLITGYPELDTGLLSENHFWLNLAGQTDHLFIQLKTSRLKNIAKQYDENTRQHRYRAIFSKKQSEELKKAIADLLERITRHENKIADLQKEFEQKQSELKRWERLRIYISEKESEAERLNFEIDTYESFLSENYAELSETEFIELEKKKNIYDALQKKIYDLEGQLIEQEHLEKNMVNLLKETEALEAWIKSSDHSQSGMDLQKQLKDYQDEIKKIRQQLKKTPRLTKDLEEARFELEEYRRGHDQYGILAKLRQWTQQNNRKSIQNALEQARKNKSAVLSELEKFSRTSAGEQEEACRHSIRQTENLLIQARLQLHQLREQQQILAERQQKALTQIKTETDVPLFSTHSYLTMMEKIYTSLMNDLAIDEKRVVASNLTDTIKKFNAISEFKFSDELSDWLVTANWETALNNDFGLSHSEKTTLILLLRFLIISRYSKCFTLFSDNPLIEEVAIHTPTKQLNENFVTLFYHPFHTEHQPLQVIVLK